MDGYEGWMCEIGEYKERYKVGSVRLVMIRNATRERSVGLVRVRKDIRA